MESQYQKDKEFHKVEKKLAKAGATLEELLQEECIVEMFRSNHKGLHSQYYLKIFSLKLKDFKDLITYVTVLGSPDDKMRGYKYPQIAAEILSSQIPKVLEVMFSSSQEPNSPTLFELLMKYFQAPPNDTLSGYVIKILTPLYTYEPVRIQQAIIESGQLMNISKFTYSRSVSEFIIKLIVVESENLLTVHFKQRKQLFLQLIEIYQKSEKEQVYMLEIQYILGEIITKLWNDKHKELGKMAQTIIKMVETVLIKPKLYNQQHLMLTIISNIVHYSDSSSHLIKVILNKAYKQLSAPGQQTLRTSKKIQIPKFGIKKFYLLKCITLAVCHCPNIISETPNLHTFPYRLLELVSRHEWNSILHVEVQIIFKEIFKPTNLELFKLLLQKWSLTQTLKQMIRKEERKISQGYAGILNSIMMLINESINKDTQIGKYLRFKQPLLPDACNNYLRLKEKLTNLNLAGYKANLEFSKPQYNQQDLLHLHKQFFQQSHILQEITKINTPRGATIPEDMFDEIENENIINSSWVMKPAQKV